MILAASIFVLIYTTALTYYHRKQMEKLERKIIGGIILVSESYHQQYLRAVQSQAVLTLNNNVPRNEMN